MSLQIFVLFYCLFGVLAYDAYTGAASPGEIVAMIIGLLICIGGVAGTVFYFVKQYLKLQQESEENQQSVEVNDESNTSSLNVDDDIKIRSCSVRNYEKYFMDIMKNSQLTVSKQFHDIEEASSLDHRPEVYNDTAPGHDRYRNIKPFIHNRIRLNAEQNYINASRICPVHWDSQCKCNDFYIATQGPLSENGYLKETIPDFWRMVFENNVGIIVNLTRCVEGYKEKCSQYWPETLNENMVYRSCNDTITVKLTRSVPYEEIFVERTLVLSMNDESIHVVQLHMICWNDHGCPEVRDFIDFYKAFQKLKGKTNKPVVVHCSAGVGRTGTFILIDVQLKSLQSQEDEIKIYDNLIKLRKCRMSLVQTENQYVFVHQVIEQYLAKEGILYKSPPPDSSLLSQKYSRDYFIS